MIGIKIADGSYFPVIREAERKKKKLILTTVKDEQPTVQIDLYRGTGDEMTDPHYIGSLMIDNIAPAPGGDPEIELYMGIDSDGNLFSRAQDLKSRVEKSISVNLEELPSDQTYTNPDFELTEPEEDNSMTAVQAASQNEDTYDTPYFNPYTSEEVLKDDSKSNRPLLLMAAGGILAAVILVFIIFIFPLFSKEKTDVQAKTEAPVQTKAQSPALPAGVPLQAAAAEPAAQDTKPIISRPESTGVWYSTVKGDNLWNLSGSFYANPWLYKKIAEENGISNPDLIPQNHRLYIPDVETGKR